MGTRMVERLFVAKVFVYDKQSQKLCDCGDFYSLSVCASILTKDFNTFPRLKVTNETRAPQFVRDAQILAAPHQRI